MVKYTRMPRYRFGVKKRSRLRSRVSKRMYRSPKRKREEVSDKDPKSQIVPGKDEVQLWITRFGIKKQFQNRGLGRYALCKIIDYHRNQMQEFENSAKIVIVECVQNEKMVKLCESLNFASQDGNPQNYTAELDIIPRASQVSSRKDGMRERE